MLFQLLSYCRFLPYQENGDLPVRVHRLHGTCYHLSRCIIAAHGIYSYFYHHNSPFKSGLR